MAKSEQSSKKRKPQSVQASPSEPDVVQKMGVESETGTEPVAEEQEKPKRSFEIAIFTGWCKGCGICAAFCPRECIAMGEDGSPVVKDEQRCTGCGFCEIHCPDFAISVRPRKKASATED